MSDILWYTVLYWRNVISQFTKDKKSHDLHNLSVKIKNKNIENPNVNILPISSVVKIIPVQQCYARGQSKKVIEEYNCHVELMCNEEQLCSNRHVGVI